MHSCEIFDPLDVVAGKIRALLQKAEDQRLAAALLLKQAKERVEGGEHPRFSSFSAWCRQYLPERSQRDIRRLLQIASAPDPESALNEMRSKGREQTRRWRVKADSRESAQPTGTKRDVDPGDTELVPDCDTFERLVRSLEEKRDLSLDLRIPMARRLVDALGIDVEATELSKDSESENGQDNGGRETPEGRDARQNVITQASIVIHPNIDPHNDRDPLWWRGGLQLVSQLAQEASTLDNPPNSDRISDPTLQLIDVLAPIFLETPIPRGRRGKILELLLYCGYRDFVDQLVCRWTEADQAAASGQPEQMDLEKWIATKAAAPSPRESQAGLPNPERDTVLAEANP
jgi:hypothetical protein